MTAIIDYGAGNIRSVANALERAGADYCLTADAAVIQAADHVVLPGVGEAAWAMERLRQRGLDRLVPALRQPVLGICIGLQLMCAGSEEGDVRCLGLFDTEVRRLSAVPDGDGGGRLKVPHVGWNTVEQPRGPLFEGLPGGTFFYYVHSFAADVCAATAARTVYGRPFAAALSCGNFHGVQFHPEKSGAAGARLLENFLRM